MQPTPLLDLQSGGIATLGKDVVAVDGRRLVRVDTASGAITPIAGDQSASGCQNSPTGSAVRFGRDLTRMMGTDGAYIYVADFECGPRRIDATTGATTNIATERYDYGTVAGQFLYGITRDGEIYRHNLGSPTQRTQIGWTPAPGPIAADAESVWHVDGWGGVLHRIPLDTLETEAIGGSLPVCRGAACDTVGRSRVASALVSAGGMLYAAIRSTQEPYGFTTLVAINKYSYASEELAGTEASAHRDGGWIYAAFSSITGLAADGKNLLVLDQGTATTHLRKVSDPLAAIDAIVAGSNEPPVASARHDGRAGTRAIDIGPEQPVRPRPTASSLWQNYFAHPENLPPINPYEYATAADPIILDLPSHHRNKTPLVWSPGPITGYFGIIDGFKVRRAESATCIENCDLLYWLAEELYKAEGGGYTWWDQLSAELTKRTVVDFAQDILYLMIDTQLVYSRDGSLNPVYAAEIAADHCEYEAIDPPIDCSPEYIMKVIDESMTWADLAAQITTVYYTLKQSNRRKAMMKTEHYEAWQKFQQMADLACAAVPKPTPLGTATTLTKQQKADYGNAVHAHFAQLIQNHRNATPGTKIWGETGYNGGVSIPGPSKQNGFRYPDAVWGVAADKPELLFDLKTGLSLIPRGWLTDLNRKLPAGYEDARVIRLNCP